MVASCLNQPEENLNEHDSQLLENSYLPTHRRGLGLGIQFF